MFVFFSLFFTSSSTFFLFERVNELYAFRRIFVCALFSSLSTRNSNPGQITDPFSTASPI